MDVSSGVGSSTARLVRPVQTVPCTVTPLGTSDALSPVGTRPLVKHAVANSAAVVASVMTPTVQLVRAVGTIGATWKHEKATLLANQRDHGLSSKTKNITITPGRTVNTGSVETFEFGIGAATVPFVRIVATLIDAIAQIAQIDASSVGTGELDPI